MKLARPRIYAPNSILDRRTRMESLLASAVHRGTEPPSQIHCLRASTPLAYVTSLCHKLDDRNLRKSDSITINVLRDAHDIKLRCTSWRAISVLNQAKFIVGVGEQGRS